MPTLTFKYNVLRLDERTFTRTLEKHIEQVLRQSIRVFLREVAKGLPVWTGRAKKSLAPLAHSLHIAWNISPTASSYEQGRNKSEPNDVVTMSWKDAIQRNGNIWTVSLGSGVFYFDINEVMNVNAAFGFHLRHPGPWKLFELGQDLANQYIEEHMHTGLPKLVDYILFEPKVIIHKS